MKIYDAKCISAADAYTIAFEHIASHDLMERASRAVTSKILETYSACRSILVVCGNGNNGGDGLCIARQLDSTGREVSVFPAIEEGEPSPDFRFNAERLKATNVSLLTALPSLTDNRYDLIIDALFGTGLTRPIEGKLATLIASINSSNHTVIAVDTPSGMPCSTAVKGACIRATATFTFQWPKPAFFLPENAIYTGEWQVIPIGLQADFPGSEHAFGEWIEHAFVQQLYIPRKKISHKGTYGHTLILAGNSNMPGAGVLAATACLTAGAGKVTLATDAPTMAISPEIMLCSRAEGLKRALEHTFQAIAIGPGWGTDDIATDQLLEVLPAIRTPLVLDADALNILAKQENWSSLLPEESILTPHPGEFARLAGPFEDDYNELESQLALSSSAHVNIVLKRAYTCMTTSDGSRFFNSTGNPGMATAGSGDVLTGIIAACISQRYTAKDAMLMGVYLHGMAGDIAMAKKGGQNIIAGDITAHLQKAFATLIR